jgi:hypothetical protein
MAKIIDGPACGHELKLTKNPAYLRVARTADLKWRGVAHPKDTVKQSDAVVAYRLSGKDEYSVVEPQPPQDEMRNNALWFRWVQKQRANP